MSEFLEGHMAADSNIEIAGITLLEKGPFLKENLGVPVITPHHPEVNPLVGYPFHMRAAPGHRLSRRLSGIPVPYFEHFFRHEIIFLFKNILPVIGEYRNYASSLSFSSSSTLRAISTSEKGF